MRLLYGTLLAMLAIAQLPPVFGWWWWPWSTSEPYWNNLRTTFALDYLNPFSSESSRQAYQPVPRTVSDAIGQNWVPISTSCDNNGLFNGLQYGKSINGVLDTSVTALYDKNGIIVGIQMNIAVAEAKADPNNTYKYDEIAMFLRNTVNGVDSYTLTAYFTDPATICTTGRNASALSINGTADQVFFQNGVSPSQLIVAPLNRTVGLTQGWSNNNCFIGMGVHNWYQQEQFQETHCDYIRPVFLLYNKQNVFLGFGFQHVGKTTSPSNRYEYPDDKAVKMIVGSDTSTYQCLLDKATKGNVGVTTLHVYLIDNPGSQLCIV